MLLPTIRCLAIAATLCVASACRPPAPPHLVVWAWERPEDLRFLPADTKIAVLTGILELSGDNVTARGRRFPLLTGAAPVVSTVVHVEIGRAPLDWTPALAATTAAAVVAYGVRPGIAQVQLDFEVSASQRRVLLDVLREVRQRLPRDTRLSMTALASWCDGERWLTAAPVDEIVPMLFRMGPGGAGLLDRASARRAFGNPRCRAALGIATDEPIAAAPHAQNVYLFSPRRWTARSFARTQEEIARWGGWG